VDFEGGARKHHLGTCMVIANLIIAYAMFFIAPYNAPAKLNVQEYFITFDECQK